MQVRRQREDPLSQRHVRQDGIDELEKNRRVEFKVLKDGEKP